jgi:hypothetical protein
MSGAYICAGMITRRGSWDMAVLMVSIGEALPRQLSEKLFQSQDSQILITLRGESEAVAPSLSLGPELNDLCQGER